MRSTYDFSQLNYFYLEILEINGGSTREKKQGKEFLEKTRKSSGNTRATASGSLSADLIKRGSSACACSSTRKRAKRPDPDREAEESTRTPCQVRRFFPFPPSAL